MEGEGSRRRLTRGLEVLALLLVSVVALLLSALYHLGSSDGRWAVARIASSALSDLFVGDLSIEGVDALSLSRIELHGAALTDGKGRPVARIGRLAIELELADLLNGEIHATSVVVEEPWAFVGPSDEVEGDELALVAALAFANPSPNDDQPAGEIPVIRIDEIRIDRASVDGLPEALSVSDASLEGRFVLDPHVRVELSSLRAMLSRDGEPVATIASLAGRFDMTPGAHSEVSLIATAGEDHLEAEGALAWTEEGPGPAEAEVRFELSPALATALGIEGVEDVVDSRVSGTVSAEGTLDDVEVEANLETDGGTLRLAATRRGETATAHLETDGLSLGEIVPSLGDVSAEGVVDATLSPISGPDRRVELIARDVRYDEWVVPEARAQGTFGESGMTLEGIEVPHLSGDGGHLDVQATLAADGTVNADIDAYIPNVAADANVRRLAPGVRGGVRADLHARVESGEDRIVDVRGTVSADHLRIPGLTARRVRVRGTASGRLSAPVLDVQVDANTVGAGGIAIRNVSAAVRGGPSRYAMNGDVVLSEGQRITLDASAEVRGGEYYADATTTVRGIWPEPVAVTLSRMHLVPDRYVSFERLSAESTGLSVGASGRYAFQGESDLRAHVATLDLERLGRALRSPFMTGAATGDATFAGTVRAPEIAVDLRVSDATAGPLELPALNVEARLSAESGDVSLSADADAAGYGRAEVEARGRLGSGRDVEARLRSGVYQADVSLDDVPAAVLSLASPDLPPFDGVIDARANLRGVVGAPELDVTLNIDGFAAPGVEPIDVDVGGAYADAGATATVSARDAEGMLLSAHAEMPIDLPTVIRTGAFDPLAADLDLTVSVAERRLDQLPAPLTIPVAAHASAELLLTRRGGATAAELSGRVTRFEDALADVGCIPGPMPVLTYQAVLSDGQTSVTAQGDVGGVSAGTLHAAAETPVDAWLADGFPDAPPPISLEARISGLDLGRIPVVCSTARGALTLSIDATDLLTPLPRIDIEGAIDGFSVYESAPIEVRLSGGLDPDALSLDAVMHDGTRSVLELDARAPITMGEDGLTPALRDEPWSARLRLDRTPAEPVLALLPWVRQPDGGLDGTVTVRGRGTDIVADGEIALRDVSFIVTDPVFRVERLNGAIGFERGAVVLRDLGMRDRDGTVSVDGRLGLEGLYPRDFRLAIVADGMPLRNEGVVFAFADANIDVEGHLSDEEREVRATFDDFSIELPQELGHSVQGLGQHPDVIYEDQPGFFPEATATGDALVPDEADDPAIPTRVIVDATQPFWIRRDDFSIQLTADLRIDSDDRGARITGLVQVKRGFINLVGRSFDFEDGEIVFDGGRRVDPTLDLSAIHTLESRETVTVNISGRLSNPTINFTTTVPGAETEAEIIALLVSGRGGSAMQAKDQAVSVLGGMAASFISSMTRRTAGAYIPRLSIESTSNSTRVRAGISADALIPEFLDEIVESAYVEGFVGQREGTTTAGGDTTSSGATGGFLIELYWPRSIVTTGTYEQPVNWSLDLTWEP